MIRGFIEVKVARVPPSNDREAGGLHRKAAKLAVLVLGDRSGSDCARKELAA